MDFKEELKNYQNIVEAELKKYVKNEACPEKMLNESMEYSLISGGKRIRPILVLATNNLFLENNKICMPYAVAIEMVHNFSLIHDDLPAIDNDDFRHGKLTNHKKFNEATAVLAGDGLLNKAFIVISEDLINTTDLQELQNKVKVFNEFAVAIDRMIAGELDPELVVSIAEGLTVVDSPSRYIH